MDKEVSVWLYLKPGGVRPNPASEKEGFSTDEGWNGEDANWPDCQAVWHQGQVGGLHMFISGASDLRCHLECDLTRRKYLF